MANRLPPQSTTYTTPSASVGVAVTSPPVVKTHLVWGWPGLAGETWDSAGRDRVSAVSWPAVGQLAGFDAANAGAAIGRAPTANMGVTLRLRIAPQHRI